MAQIQVVAVIGAGSMGTGIAQVCASHGYDVNLYDVSKEILDRSVGAMSRSLGKLVEKGKIDEDRKRKTIERIRTFSDIASGMESADLVVEALPESFDMKTAAYRKIEDRLKPGAIIGSNTSSLPITALAAATRRGDRFIGLHFMNPVPLMDGIEIIRGRNTSDDTLKQARSFAESLGKKPSIAVDYAGFVVSRLINVYLNEAALAVMDGNDPGEVDRAMVTCTNMPIGPCKLMDLVGIDVVVSVLGTLEGEFGERFRCAPLLKQMARAGHFGVKTKQGFYSY